MSLTYKLIFVKTNLSPFQRYSRSSRPNVKEQLANISLVALQPLSTATSS